ncbi:MAG: AAA family ATPase [Pseudomonadota bacterium]
MKTGRLILFGGRPGVGKSTLARALADRIGAVWLRIDSIEGALAASTLAITQAEDAGYAAARAVAADNIRLGRDVIADAVNAEPFIRDWWAEMPREIGASLFTVEVICSDPALHRARIEARHAGDPRTPDWNRVTSRHYVPWEDADLRVDTAAEGNAVERIVAALP